MIFILLQERDKINRTLDELTPHGRIYHQRRCDARPTCVAPWVAALVAYFAICGRKVIAAHWASYTQASVRGVPMPGVGDERHIEETCHSIIQQISPTG